MFTCQPDKTGFSCTRKSEARSGPGTRTPIPALTGVLPITLGPQFWTRKELTSTLRAWSPFPATIRVPRIYKIRALPIELKGHASMSGRLRIFHADTHEHSFCFLLCTLEVARRSYYIPYEDYSKHGLQHCRQYDRE